MALSRRFIIFSALFIGLIGCRTFSPEASNLTSEISPLEKNFCIQTFNVFAPGYALKKSSRMEKTGKALKQSGPCEIINMQELWTDKYRDLMSKSITAAFPGTSIHNADQFEGSSGMRGLTSYFRAPVSSKRTHDYPINSSGVMDDIRWMMGVKKAIHLATLEMEEGKLLSINTHTHQAKVDIRIAQVLELAKTIAQKASNPNIKGVVVTGDFNATPNSLEYALLRDLIGLEDAWLSAKGSYKDICTYCKENSYYLGGSGDRVIDFIFYRSLSSDKSLKTVNAIISPVRYGEYFLSDHYGVRAKLEFNTDTTTPSQNEVKNRKERAMTALDRARRALKQTGDSKYKDVLLYIDELTTAIFKDDKTNQLRRIMDIR